jgi:hypothetical protein
MANESPPWAAYHTLIAGCLVALDKCPECNPSEWGELGGEQLPNPFFLSPAKMTKNPAE